MCDKPQSALSKPFLNDTPAADSEEYESLKATAKKVADQHKSLAIDIQRNPKDADLFFQKDGYGQRSYTLSNQSLQTLSISAEPVKKNEPKVDALDYFNKNKDSFKIEVEYISKGPMNSSSSSSSSAVDSVNKEKKIPRSSTTKLTIRDLNSDVTMTILSGIATVLIKKTRVGTICFTRMPGVIKLEGDLKYDVLMINSIEVENTWKGENPIFNYRVIACLLKYLEAFHLLFIGFYYSCDFFICDDSYIGTCPFTKDELKDVFKDLYLKTIGEINGDTSEELSKKFKIYCMKINIDSVVCTDIQ